MCRRTWKPSDNRLERVVPPPPARRARESYQPGPRIALRLQRTAGRAAPERPGRRAGRRPPTRSPASPPPAAAPTCRRSGRPRRRRYRACGAGGCGSASRVTSLAVDTYYDCTLCSSGERKAGMQALYPVLLLGAGKIGSAVARLLANCGDYDVLVGDVDERALARLAGTPQLSTLRLDVTSPAALRKAVGGRKAVLSALSFDMNVAVANAAL